MKVWRLVSGILSIVFSLFVLFQACAAVVGNALAENGEISGSAGLLVALLMLSAGIVSIAGRKAVKKGIPVAILVMDGLAGLLGMANAGSYADLKIWSGWCLICAVMALLSMTVLRVRSDGNEE